MCEDGKEMGLSLQTTIDIKIQQRCVDIIGDRFLPKAV